MGDSEPVGSLMGRRPLAPGELGKVSVRLKAQGSWNARANMRDYAGKLHEISASGATEEEARDRLAQEHLRRLRRKGSTLNAASTFEEAGEAWLAHQKNRVTPSSLTRYRSSLAKVVEDIRALPIGEIDTGMLEDAIENTLDEEGLAQARSRKKVISQVLGFAAKRKAIAVNPARDVSQLPSSDKRESALSPADMRELRSAIEAWGGGRHRGKKSDWKRLLDVLEIALGAGARVGEVLAIRRRDLNLDRGWVNINGTIVDAVKDHPVHRQNHTKTRNVRDVPLSPAAQAAARRRLELIPDGPNELIFQIQNGGPVAPVLIGKAMRAFRAADPDIWERLDVPLTEASTHLMRRSAATYVERRGGIQMASRLLGHANESVTRSVYVTTSRGADEKTAGIMADFDE